MSAAALNNTDIRSREGAYGTAGDPDAMAGWRGVPLEFPRVQGGDIAGTVVAVGDGVDPSRLGERVVVDCALYERADDAAHAVGLVGSERDGGFAQFVAVEGQRAHDMEASLLSDEELASLPIAYGTAMGMLERAELVPGERVLVTGASGGVGVALVQLAAARGCPVVAITIEEKGNQVRAAGASQILPRDAVPADHLAERVDVVADVVGGPGFPRLVDVLAEGGRVVVAGAIAGPVIEIDVRHVYLHSRRLIGSAMWTPAHFATLVEEARNGSFRPVAAEVFPLEEIGAAQREFLGKQFVGKLVLSVPTTGS
ncbi:MAG: zinc-binding dehydrogenase [Actinomycetes bacterium]